MNEMLCVPRVCKYVVLNEKLYHTKNCWRMVINNVIVNNTSLYYEIGTQREGCTKDCILRLSSVLTPQYFLDVSNLC